MYSFVFFSSDFAANTRLRESELCELLYWSFRSNNMVSVNMSICCARCVLILHSVWLSVCFWLLSWQNLFACFSASEAGGEDALVGNVNKLVMSPPGYSGAPRKGHLVFDACFESGEYSSPVISYTWSSCYWASSIRAHVLLAATAVVIPAHRFLY